MTMFLRKFYFNCESFRSHCLWHLYKDEISDIFKNDWDPSSKARTSSILNAICTFNFLISFLCVYKMLSHLSGITIKLQGSTIDNLQAFDEIESVKGTVMQMEKTLINDRLSVSNVCWKFRIPTIYNSAVIYQWNLLFS